MYDNRRIFTTLYNSDNYGIDGVEQLLLAPAHTLDSHTKSIRNIAQGNLLGNHMGIHIPSLDWSLDRSPFGIYVCQPLAAVICDQDCKFSCHLCYGNTHYAAGHHCCSFPPDTAPDANKSRRDIDKGIIIDYATIKFSL